MNVCARQFFDCAAWSEGVNGDVIAARDNGELFGLAAVLVGDLFIDGRALASAGLAPSVTGALAAVPGGEPTPWPPIPTTSDGSPLLLYRWACGGAWAADVSPAAVVMCGWG